MIAHRSAQSTFAVLLALLFGAGGAGSASAAEAGSGMVFEDERKVSLEAGETAQTRTVTLCNVSGAPATGLRWSLRGFQFTAGEAKVGDQEVVSLVGTGSSVEAGVCDQAKIRVKANTGIGSGPFSGVLVVTSAGSGVARLEVEVAGSPSTVVPAKGAAETIELTATRWVPFTDRVSVDSTGALALKAPPEGKELEVAPEGALIGNLVKEGDVASVYVTGAPDKKDTPGVWLLPIEIRGADHPGEYEGTLTPTAKPDEKQTVKAKVSVTDFWGWAVLAVLFGALVVVVLPTVWIRRKRLESKLHDRHRAVAGDYTSAEQAFHEQFPDFAGIKAPTEEDIATYTGAVDKAIRAYAESTWYFDTTGEAYKEIDKALDVVEGDIACLKSKEGLGKALADLDTALDNLAKGLKGSLPIDRQPAIALAASALLQPGHLAVGEATKRVEIAGEFVKAIETWSELAKTMGRCEAWYRALKEFSDPDKGQNFSDDELAALQEISVGIAIVRNELLEAADAEDISSLKIDQRLTRVNGRLASLGAKYNVWVVAEEASSTSADHPWPGLRVEGDGGSGGVSGQAEREIVAQQQQLGEACVEPGSWRANAHSLTATAAKPVELGKTKRFVGDTLVVLLSAATGVVAALSGFYFGKTFGTVADYLTVIFLGTAVQAFLKPISDTLAQLRGGAEPVTKADAEEPTVLTTPASSAESNEKE